MFFFVSSEQWDVPMKDGTTPYIPTTPKVVAVTQLRIMCPPPYTSLLSKNVKIKTHDTAVLPLVLYCCETRCLTLRWLRMFGKRVARGIFGPEVEEMT